MQTTLDTYDTSAAHGGRLTEEDRYASDQNVGTSATPDEKTKYVYDDSATLLPAEQTDQGNVAEVDDYALEGGSLQLADFTHYTYDPISGGQATITTADGTIHYVYDEATGNLVETWTGANASAPHSAAQNDVLYGYDNQGRLKSVTQVVLNGSTPPAVAGGTRYDADGNAISTTQPTTVYTYDNAGNLLSDAEPNGDTTAYTYNNLNQLTLEVITDENTGHPVFREQTAWLDDGQKAGAVDVRYNPDGSTASEITYVWTYDADDRLASEALTVQSGSGSNVPAPYVDRFQYDLDNNRTQETEAPAVGQTVTETIGYSYDGDEQLTTEAGNGTNNYTTQSGYDADGNLISQARTGDGAVASTYGYDLRNRMTSATVAEVTTAYTYDYTGVLTSETTTGVATYDLNDPNNPTGYSKAVQQSATPGGTPTASYVLGLQVEAQSDPTRGGTVYLLMDGHGSTRALADTTGAVVAGQTFDYDAFGTTLTNAGTADTDWLFGGDGSRDAATGFTYQLARWRNGDSFTTSDFGGWGNNANPLTLNDYVYGNGNPTLNTDPTGHDSLSDQAFALAGLVQNEAINVLPGLFGAAHDGLANASQADSLDTSYTSAATFGSGSVYSGIATTVESGISAAANWLDADPTSVYQGAVQGAWAGLLNFADKATFQQEAWLHNYRNSYWQTTGLAGTSTETASNVAAWISVAAFSLADAIGAGSSGCFVAATPVTLGNGEKKAIGDIQVGDRVATDGGAANSADGKTVAADPNSTNVDPKTWRLVTLQMDDRWADGTDDIVQIEALEPLSEIEADHVQVGAFAPIPLDMADMALPDDPALVLAITNCPVIAKGNGRVVLATVTHLNNDVFRLTLKNSFGLADGIQVTAYHKIYAEDRGWVNASDLKIGEVVRGINGDLVVASLAKTDGDEHVYNISVESDHVYYVGNVGALVHNVWCDGMHHVVPRYLGGTDADGLVFLKGATHQAVHAVMDAELRAAFRGMPGLPSGRVFADWALFFGKNKALRKRAQQIAVNSLYKVLGI